ncbi:MAG TPA: complex I subunit 5 family protein [Acidocella sp.]|jgi:multicomponent Na+:H+ antiporter subunit D|nr:complex I subunit 5 family protein [Acidocella sp.]
MMLPLLPPLPVVMPLTIAALLLAFSHVLPRPVPDAVALFATVMAGGVCLAMLGPALHAPLVYWFGGWVPRHGFPIGIGFYVDPPSAAMGVFIAVLFTAALVFSWGYYDEVHAHFHVLMLLFLAGMIGFCLTHDLFDMFVWFEVISVAAYALTGYQLRVSALEGAINFTIVNSIGSYLFLAGIGLVYIRIGALDFSALEQGMRQATPDMVARGGFVLVATGLLIKAAQVPFHFWLSDAHAVAPSPVSVIFSGVMVALGMFGLAKLCWTVFLPAGELTQGVRHFLLGMGIVTVLLGGLMALSQRHLKRLLAFSTISHTGMLLIGLASFRPQGLAGLFVYLVGHGLVKGALFMISGILLATRGGIDELGLRGAGRPIWPAGLAMAAGGVLLAGLPFGLMGQGDDYISAPLRHSLGGIVPFAIVFGAACTAGAVLRAAGRIFLGLGPVAGEEERGPTDEEAEKADRPLWLMLWPAVILLLLSLIVPNGANAFLTGLVRDWLPPESANLTTGAPMLQKPPHDPAAWFGLPAALALAAFDLMRHRLPAWFVGMVDKMKNPLLRYLQAAHSGDVRDYVAWAAFGLATFAVVWNI